MEAGSEAPTAAATASPGSSRQQWDWEASRHFYIAVDRQEFKMGTFFDLLEHFWKRSGVPLVICCNSRDSLDAVFAAVSSRSQFSANFLHSDLSEKERVATMDEFRRATMEWRNGEVPSSEDGIPLRLFLLVVTDACLPSNILGESSLSARAIINYDLPVKKEAYLRRLTSCLSPVSVKAGSTDINTSGIVLNFVVGGEVATLKAIEEGFGVIHEMPINVIELL